ncbi:MAG: ATP-binding cassette domain-containing protein [Spirochaetaceae bacterium]|nr:MAG: ATP-binding cassette domain-containing protein [Spirochaetaceae bacterium]
MKLLQYATGFLLFLLVWWGGSLLVGSAVLPAPRVVFQYIASTEVLSAVSRELVITLRRGFVGFLLALLVALPTGVLMGRRRSRERLGFFPLLMLQSAPPLFWITPLVLWLGTRGPVPVTVAFLVTLPLLTLHTMMAIRHIPAWEYDVFAVYAPRRWVVARELYLPHLLPALKSNAHLGTLVAIKAAMLAEWFAAQNGFGRVVRIHYQTFAMQEFVSWAFLFLLVVGGISFGIEVVLKRTMPVYRATAVGNDVPPVKHERPVPAEAATLTVDGLGFGYGRTPLFENLSLRVTAEQPVVLYGESGCGKTTLLKTISGLLQPWSGTVKAEGGVGLVFQDDALLAHRDALGNVLLPAMPRIAADDVARAREALALWGLGHREDAFPHELSGGMRKRLAMARAWFLAPRVLLLDEPFVNLDREARAALWELFFLRLGEAGKTALIVTHYREELARFPVSFLSWDRLSGTAE